jgi:4'-phosphopantetheinyl transferase
VPESWQPAAAWTPPDSRVIDIWRLDLTIREQDWEVVSPEEAERARRIIIDHKRDQKAAARAHLRRILSLYTGAKATELQFEYGEHGKPSLPGYPDLSFNLSHSERFGLLGITRDILIGVDVEHARPGRAFEDISERFFSEQERRQLLSLAAEDRAHAFYRAWTRKEAYLKAWGTGLSFASSRFTISYIEDDAGSVLETEMPDDDPERWRFVDLDVDPAFAAAACYEGEPRPTRLWEPDRA